jgi:NAD(P)-dependent dehydrogenase (short-subunit alcohol dehydrogenase family)
MDLDGKVALITGAGKGAGRALAQCFVARGALVAANDISPVNLDELAQHGNGRIRPYVEDIAKKVGVQAVVKQVEDDFGRIDILVNHAAVEPHIGLLDMDEWDWHRVLDVNLTGSFLMMQSVGRMMKQSGSGRIISLIGLDGPPHQSGPAYAASMYGLVALTRAAAAELAQFGVFVNAIGRGLSHFDEAGAKLPRTLEAAALYLCASSVSGQILNLEG